MNLIFKSAVITRYRDKARATEFLSAEHGEWISVANKEEFKNHNFKFTDKAEALKHMELLIGQKDIEISFDYRHPTHHTTDGKPVYMFFCDTCGGVLDTNKIRWSGNPCDCKEAK